MTHETQPDTDAPEHAAETASPQSGLSRRRMWFGSLMAGVAGLTAVAAVGGDGLHKAESFLCGLPADELAKRQAWYVAEVAPLVTEIVRGTGMIHFVLSGTAATTAALAQNMATLESECCAFLTVRHATDIGPTVIEIEGPDSFLDWAMGWLDADSAPPTGP